jgi:hypothetical protein
MLVAQFLKNNLKFFPKRFGGLKIRMFLCTPNHKIMFFKNAEREIKKGRKKRL